MASSTKSIRESFSEDNLAGMLEAHHELVQECQNAFTTAGGDPGTYHIHAYRPRPRPPPTLQNNLPKEIFRAEPGPGAGRS